MTETEFDKYFNSSIYPGSWCPQNIRVRAGGTITMAVTSTLYICAVALLLQNVSGVYIDPAYDCIAPWARTFLAWREANTNVAGGRLPPLLRKFPRLYSKAVCDDFPLAGPYLPGFAGPKGGLAVKSVSNGPIGVSVLSENIIEGPLAAAGQLPFLGTVALGGPLPTVGSGAVSYDTDRVKEALLAVKAGLFGYNRIGSLRY